MEDLARILREHPFLDGLKPPHIDFMVGCARNLRFEAGQFLFREGEPPGDLLLIREGQVALEVHVPGKGSQTVETVFEGDVLGWSSLFPPYQWHLDGRAVTRVRSIGFDGPCLSKKLEEDHSLGYAITKRLLYQVQQRLERVRMRQLDVYKKSTS